MMTSSKLRAAVVVGAVVCGVVAAFVSAGQQVPAAQAHHDVHFNSYYWSEWAYTPLTPVNAYDCISQNSALQGAANESNATGYVLISTQLNNCNMNATVSVGSRGATAVMGPSACRSQM